MLTLKIFRMKSLIEFLEALFVLLPVKDVLAMMRVKGRE